MSDTADIFLAAFDIEADVFRGVQGDYLADIV